MQPPVQSRAAIGTAAAQQKLEEGEKTQQQSALSNRLAKLRQI
jgi:hypothetical protein